MINYLNDYVGSYQQVEGVEVTESSGNWVTGQVDGHWFQSKVYVNPSIFGINEGRVSKLIISKTNVWPGFYREKLLFNYDRGLDFGSITSEQVNKILMAFSVEEGT